MRTLSLLVPLMVSSLLVSAHGFVGQVLIADKPFNGNIPNAPKGSSPIRQSSSSSPNYGADNVAITCGPNATPGEVIAEANPGDEIKFEWKGGDLGFWPHEIGPMITYLASCGNITCDKFDVTKAKWFKIDQVGKNPNAGNTWFQKDLKDGKVATVYIPATLAAGHYIARHEIIALHLANEAPGKAEFYPSCTQLHIGGTKTGVPRDVDLVSIPGAYQDTDPGLFVKDLFNKPDAEYVFPGPPIAKLVETTDNGSSKSASTISSGTAVPTSTEKVVTATVTVASTAPSSPTVTHSCSSGKMLKKRHTHMMDARTHH